MQLTLLDHDFITEKQIKVDVNYANKNSYFKMDVNPMFVFLKQKKNKSGRRRFCIALAKVLLLFFFPGSKFQNCFVKLFSCETV